MAEEKQVLGNSEAVRDLIVPDFQQRESPTKTERDISNEPQKGGESSNSENFDHTSTVRKLVMPTSDGGSKSSDDDRSPGRTEK
ncbi:hypothetical protein VB780_13680 [Leptolyngbya sp. CCNP1308]|uniref:hypothetical protein n=1 Tax=Leptolyngbya sp. CCNP1308 TaxID=3110255 RepID=UPI002B220894|nr:hypothetical protein [Leptolyngbya sp. CCNP1308]MEA5449630.1 hypothetical protein [Leptolyngbya sp. CCNP1308]